MYSPTAGTFLQRDPIDYEAGDANLSRYVFNAPTNFVDPSGLKTGEGKYACCCEEGKPRTKPCTEWRKVIAYNIFAGGGSNRKEAESYANEVFEQCCLKYEVDRRSTRWLKIKIDKVFGDNNTYRPYSIGNKPSVMTMNMTKNQQRDADRIPVYWVNNISGAFGAAFPTANYDAPPEPAVAVQILANKRTLAHEIGHILLNPGTHKMPRNNLMKPTLKAIAFGAQPIKGKTDDILTETQCDTIVASYLVLPMDYNLQTN